MPIFEYVCDDCSHGFEALVRARETITCPACESPKLTRQLSVFAVGSASSPDRTPVAGACGTCGDPRGPGACSMN